MDLIQSIEQLAQQRFVRWDAPLWKAFLAGPADALGESLGKGSDERAHQVMESYLRLGAEGIGLGYLFPSQSGSENVFSLVWNTLVPQLLGDVDAARRGEVLAACWNLGENLETQPLWLRRIFYRACKDLRSLGNLEAEVARVTREALAPPDKKLTQAGRVVWVPLAGEDRRFLPGAVHHLAPCVVCVHERDDGRPGREASSFGVWLSDTPAFLGPMGCNEDPKAQLDPSDLLTQASKLDPRLTEPLASSHNGYSQAVTLVTSQLLAAILP